MIVTERVRIETENGTIAVRIEDSDRAVLTLREPDGTKATVAVSAPELYHALQQLANPVRSES